MTDNLELLAINFLRWEKQCMFVLRERNPRWGTGDPDVLGVTKHRYLLEIEIKRSLSDLRADAKKPHVANREHYLERQPKQKWYLVDHSFHEKALAELPEWAGLMTVPPNEWSIRVVKKAPSNNDSTRLTVKECVKLVNCINNYNYSLEKQVDRWKNNFMSGREPYTPFDAPMFYI